jgi:hypothetical protein
VVRASRPRIWNSRAPICNSHAEVLCRNKFLKHVSALPRSYGQRLKFAKVTSPRGLTCHCSHKAGYISSVPQFIFPVVLFLLRQRRGAAGLGEL